MSDEQQLIFDLQNKSESAFKELYTRFAKQIFNTAIGFCGNTEDAEDIAQEVFVDVYKNIRQFKGDAKLSTWIYRLTINASLEHIRKQKRRKRSGVNIRIDISEGEFPLPHFQHPGVVLENKELASVLFNAIEKLPEQQRTAFTLQKIEGLSQQEIAEVLYTTESAIESLLSRARQNLKTSLLEFYSSL